VSEQRAKDRKERKLQDARKTYKEPYDLYSSPNIISVIMSIKIRCGNHVARIGKIRNYYKIPFRFFYYGLAFWLVG
jgi:hypothetical protein